VHWKGILLRNGKKKYFGVIPHQINPNIQINRIQKSIFSKQKKLPFSGFEGRSKR
jgi:hypothetical protein